MKHRVACVFLLCLLALAGSAAWATICDMGAQPSATLLLPYFEVDLGSGTGQTTLFSINNASATAALAHVVVWSDLSVPVLDFNIYLTGYDVQTINLRDILVDGKLPQTASDGQDPTDTISPQGLFSQDINFASCAGLLPPPTLPSDFVDHLQASLTGQESAVLGGCAGLRRGDGIARGYVTVDTVNGCTLRFPGDPGYFGPGGTGDATNQNILWGDYFYVNQGQSFASGNTLVHIEASPGSGTSSFNTYPAPGSPETTVAGQYTFYGRYVNWTAADNREPLATNFATRFVTGGNFSGGTSVIVWRDSKIVQNSFPCTNVPLWFPLGQEGIVIFDEQEHPQVAQTFPVSPQPPNEGLTPFPAEAQRTRVGGEDLPVPYNFGWLYLNLNTVVGVPPAVSNPSEDSTAAQAWVTTEMDANGRFSVGFEAIRLDSACQALHFVPAAP
ncbi:MAG: hypothetical protein ACJ76Y_00960 [Thermoanaerobaculia bacterium]